MLIYTYAVVVKAMRQSFSYFTPHETAGPVEGQA